MKYIYYIGITMLVVTAAIFFTLTARRQPDKKPAIIINDRSVSEKELHDFYASNPVQLDNRDALIDTLITKELLIQEAQKEGINREESFRKSVQDFYEQSLIKLLMDRKYASLNATVSDDEVRKYTDLANKKITITIFDANSLESVKRGIFKTEERKNLSYGDLSRNLQYPLLFMKEGQRSDPIKINDRYIVLRLDKIEGENPVPSGVTRDAASKILLDWKKEKIVNDWIEGLRAKATLKILAQEKGRD